MIFKIIFILIVLVIIYLLLKYIYKIYKILVTKQIITTKSLYPSYSTSVSIIPTTSGIKEIKDYTLSSDFEDNYSKQLNDFMCNNCIYVSQSLMKISNKALYTNYVGSCSVLVFSDENYNFMAHIDGGKNKSYLLTEFIKNNFSNIKNIKAQIIKGPWCNNDCNSIKIIEQSLNDLNIDYTFYSNEITWENNIIYNKKIILN